MSFDVLQLIVDFGLVILIWLVQLVIYPSFLYYTSSNLTLWHQRYMVQITYVVMPLMLLQFGLNIASVFQEMVWYQNMNLILIVAIWASTFLQFVPKHSKITSGTIDEDQLKALVSQNWTRTFLWTIIFIVRLIGFVESYKISL